MTPIFRRFAVIFAALLLASCGDDVSPDPIEQIIVAKPGETASSDRDDRSPDDMSLADGTDLVAAGERAFAACTTCHSVEKGEASSIGPNLYGVVGRKAGSKEDFKYSEAMAASSLTWDAATLDSFLANPTAKVPGTTMLAGVVPSEERRAAIIAYLSAQTE